MKKMKYILLLIVIQLLVISFIIQAENQINFVSLENLIEIIKISSTRNVTGYSAKNIFDYDIEFYVDNEKIRDFQLVKIIFKSHGIKLTDEQYKGIHNFIAFISENPKEYRHFKFNLKDVLNNLQFMDTTYAEINYIDKEKLIEIIKLSGSRARKGYDARQIFRNEIVFYIDKDKVTKFNDFPSLFKNKNIELTNEQISDIHNFIGFISENGLKYKELKFNLKDILNNLEYMKTSYAEIDFIEKEKLIEIIKLSGSRERKGYDGKQIFSNKIEFYVDNQMIDNLNGFPLLFKNKNIELTKEQISDIHNFIGFISENGFKYKKLKFNLIDVFNNLNYMH